MKNLLVHLDASPRSAERLELALRLARRHQAGLTAMYAVLPSLLATPWALGDAAGSVASLMADVDSTQRERAREVFERVAGGSSRPAVQWVEAKGEAMLWQLREMALYHDLVVLGQHDPADEKAGAVPADLAPLLMAESGRPALVVPAVGHFEALPSSVLLAWKPSREAARAATAALPLLAHAQQLHLAWRTEDGQDDPLPALTRWLRSHGVTAPVEPHRLAGDDVGDALLSLAADSAAELLVMGCYGHSRAREWVQGGATRTVLRSQTLPVLMAH